MEYRFGAVQIDLDAHEIHVDGQLAHVEPQVLGVLAHLIRERHRVVTREELLDAVWGTQYISGASVASRIKSARQVIGDDGRSQNMIRTVHGKGYRFVAELDGEPAAALADEASAARSPDGRPTPDADPAAPPVDADTWPLIGRDRDLRSIVGLVQEGRVGGVIVTGAAGLGKSRLARATIDSLAAAGTAVARVHGHRMSGHIPLAALAHLLPADIAEITDVQGDIARTILLQRARAAVTAMADDRRLVLMIDDVDQIDSLSQALLTSLIADHTVFAIMTERIDQPRPVTLEQLVSSGQIVHHRLEPLPIDQMIALLARALDGPVQPQTSDAFVEAADGHPGVMRQLVESSLASGALGIRNGVWRLQRRLTPRCDMATAIGERLAQLDDDQRDALELLAIAGELDLDLAFELLGDETLDRLELEGMISMRESGPRPRLRLAHPMYGEILVDTTSALRARRHRSRLAAALADTASADNADRLRLVRLRLENDEPVDDASLIESALLALVQSDTTVALRLLHRVSDAGRTDRFLQLLGEVLFYRGRFDEAFESWRSIDLEQAPEDVAAGAIRRIATSLFYGQWRFDEALDYLDEHLQRFDGEYRIALESYWLMIAAIDGNRAAEVLRRAEVIEPRSAGQTKLDTCSACAQAHHVLGQYDRALERARDLRELAERLQPTLYWNGPDYIWFVEVLSHASRGSIEDGWAEYDRVIGSRRSPDFGFEATAAGRLALVSGRYQQALDWLDPRIDVANALGLVTYARPLQATAAVAAAVLGDHERAVADAAAMRSDVPDVANVTALDIQWSLLHVDAICNGARNGEQFLGAAERARTAGLVDIESLLLAGAAYRGAAAAAADRLGELIHVIEGDLIGLRHRAAQQLADGDDTAPLAAEFERLGLRFERWLLDGAGRYMS